MRLRKSDVHITRRPAPDLEAHLVKVMTMTQHYIVKTALSLLGGKTPINRPNQRKSSLRRHLMRSLSPRDAREPFSKPIKPGLGERPKKRPQRQRPDTSSPQSVPRIAAIREVTVSHVEATLSHGKLDVLSMQSKARDPGQELGPQIQIVIALNVVNRDAPIRDLPKGLYEPSVTIEQKASSDQEVEDIPSENQLVPRLGA